LGINDANNPGQDLFAMKLGYSSGDNPQYNGNISSMDWYSARFQEDNTYQFTYDGANRLKNAVYDGYGNYNMNINSYNKNGNIESLTRYGKLGDSPKKSYSDTLELIHKGKKYYYTFVEY